MSGDRGRDTQPFAVWKDRPVLNGRRSPYRRRISTRKETSEPGVEPHKPTWFHKDPRRDAVADWGLFRCIKTRSPVDPEGQKPVARFCCRGGGT